MFLLDRAENFRFGNICGAIDVHQISRRAVGLIPRNAAMRVAPFGPSFDIGKVQVRNRFAIIAFHASHSVFGTFAEERGQLRSQIVAATRFEFAKEIWSPLCAVILK